MKDEPLESLDYAPAVIDLGEYRLSAGRVARKDHKRCTHKALVYDESERLIWCSDCERTLEPFDAFLALTRNCHEINNRLMAQQTEVDAAMKATTHRRAAKEMERAWAGKMAPQCPHCRAGLLPEDLERVTGHVGFEYERARRAGTKPAHRPRERA